MVTALHVSWPVATPVTLVRMSAGHSSTRSGGQVMLGLFVSMTVIVWRPLALLPQASNAVQVRAMRRALPHKLVTTTL